MQQRRDKIGPQDGLPERCSVDDVDCYLRIYLGLPAGDALFAQQQMLARGRLVLHWREIDGPNAGQEGDIPRGMMGLQLRLARDSEIREGVDYATQRIRVPRDEVFIQELAPSDPRGTLELTLSARDVRMAPWLETQSQSRANETKRTDADFAALTPRVKLTVLALDALEAQGIVIDGMPKTELRTQVEKQAQGMSPGATVSPRTLSDAEAYRRRHTK